MKRSYEELELKGIKGKIYQEDSVSKKCSRCDKFISNDDIWVVEINSPEKAKYVFCKDCVDSRNGAIAFFHTYVKYRNYFLKQKNRKK